MMEVVSRVGRHAAMTMDVARKIVTQIKAPSGRGKPSATTIPIAAMSDKPTNG